MTANESFFVCSYYFVDLKTAPICSVGVVCHRKRPQRVILLLIIGCQSVRNDHKIASTELPLDRNISKTILFPKVIFGRETLFVRKAEQKNSCWFLRHKLWKKRRGGNANVIMHSQTFHIFNQEEWCEI